MKEKNGGAEKFCYDCGEYFGPEGFSESRWNVETPGSICLVCCRKREAARYDIIDKKELKKQKMREYVKKNKDRLLEYQRDRRKK